MNRWLVAAVVLGCWGCAFSLDGPDPSRPRNRVPICDSSKGLVALDGVMATALGVLALAVVSDGSGDAASVALLPLGIGALYLGGAVSGNRKANECQAALDEYSNAYGDERMALDGDEGAPSGTDDNRRSRPRNTRSTGQGPGAQATYGQGYPPPYQAPQQPAVVPPRSPAQPPVQQMPPTVAPQPQQPQQGKPAKGPKAPPPPAPDEDDWSDFWREVP